MNKIICPYCHSSSFDVNDYFYICRGGCFNNFPHLKVSFLVRGLQIDFISIEKPNQEILGYNLDYYHLYESSTANSPLLYEGNPLFEITPANFDRFVNSVKNLKAFR